MSPAFASGCILEAAVKIPPSILALMAASALAGCGAAIATAPPPDHPDPLPPAANTNRPRERASAPDGETGPRPAPTYRFDDPVDGELGGDPCPPCGMG